MITEDKFVPVGTPVLDQNSQAPVTVRRDYGHGHVPACELDLEGVRKLRSVLDDLEAEILAYEGRAAEEAALDAPQCRCAIGSPSPDLIPPACPVHGVPCEECGGVEECAEGCGT